MAALGQADQSLSRSPLDPAGRSQAQGAGPSPALPWCAVREGQIAQQQPRLPQWGQFKGRRRPWGASPVPAEGTLAHHSTFRHTGTLALSRLPLPLYPPLLFPILGAAGGGPS